MYTLDELKGMVFIDIETTTQTENLQELLDKKPRLEEFWDEKFVQLKEQNRTELGEIEDKHQMYPRMGGLYPEWGKIVCISIGQLKFDETGMPVGFNAKSYYGDDEKKLLSEFMSVAGAIMNKKSSIKWVGHFIKGFDMPYIIKRSIINQVPVIRHFHLHKLKPWETCLIDTKEVWQFGNWNGSARLGHIAEILDIPTPKDDMAGYQVNRAYWEGRIEEIKVYCEKDIKATANMLLRLSGVPILEETLGAPF
jgi:predicted PolB exonuclease-like 3'-5' exonuclease